MIKELWKQPIKNIFEEPLLLQNLSLIHHCESYCLRRIPRLVNQVETIKLSQVLSDQVSLIMDRLDLLDSILSHSQCPADRESTYPVRNNFKIFLAKDDINNKKLIKNLLKLSRYRLSLYQLVVVAYNKMPETSTSTLLTHILHQEEKFCQDLETIQSENLILPRIYQMGLIT